MTIIIKRKILPVRVLAVHQPGAGAGDHRERGSEYSDDPAVDGSGKYQKANM